jgi:hypothetical protein
MRRLRATAVPLLLLLAAAVFPACGPAEPDAKAALELVEVTTGWLDRGIVNGQNKVVPTIAFRVRNRGDRAISGVQINAVFRIVDDTEELGARLVRAIERPLAAGGSVGPFVLSSELGYTSEASRVEMLRNSNFRDAKVEVFAKHGSRQWVKLAEMTIQRQLLTR